MKVRTGFVSNSSSSSFIVIGNSKSVDTLLSDNGILIVSDKDTFCEFGWGPEVIREPMAKIMFAYLQSENNELWREMLEKVIKDNSDIKEIVWDVNKDNNFNAYIDHQSSASEGSNIEIFDSEDYLKRFIFCPNSKIVLDNDNH